jgi:hypothetical protein
MELNQLDHKNKTSNPYEKYIDFIIIFHSNGLPIYSSFFNTTYVPYENKIIYSGILSAIISYNKSIDKDNAINSIKLFNSEIFFSYSSNIIFILALNTQLIKLNKLSHLASEFMKKLQDFFWKEIDIKDFSVLSKQNNNIIKTKINSITTNLFRKTILIFYF